MAIDIGDLSMKSGDFPYVCKRLLKDKTKKTVLVADKERALLNNRTFRACRSQRKNDKKKLFPNGHVQGRLGTCNIHVDT